MSDSSTQITTESIENIVGGGKISVVKVLLLFYLLVMLSYSKNLIGKPLKEFIEDNRLAQHTIGFLTVFVLISLHNDFTDSSVMRLSITEMLIYTIIGYTWFIFSSKLDAQWNIILLVVLMMGFLLDTYLRNQEYIMRTSEVMTPEQKEQKIEQNNKYRTYLAFGAILVTAIGTVLYSNRKHEQYGGSYDLMTYLLY